MKAYSIVQFCRFVLCLAMAVGSARALAEDDTFVFVDDAADSDNLEPSDGALIVTDSDVTPSNPPQTEIAFQPPAAQLALQPKGDPPVQQSARGDLTVHIPEPFRPAEKPAAEPETTAPSKLGEVERLLVQAHTASQQAATETDYSEVVDSCVAALQFGARDENKEFAQNLISWALNRRGQLYAGAGKAELAEADFQEAVHLDANNWRALHNRGVSLAERGQFADAFDDFNQVIELNPKFAKAYTNRATLYVQAGDLASAREDYALACRLDPQLASARLGLARACHMAGQLEEALKNFTTALKLDPENAGTLCSRGDLHADMGHYGQALADYADAIEVQPGFAHAYRNGAWLLATCPEEEFRDAENAILGAQQALEFNYGERYVALDTLAAALANAGRFDEAITTLQEAIETAPSALRAEYETRIKLYQSGQPYRTQPVGKITQAAYRIAE